jgi:NADH-ubiquinone oxidoreductase chain 1
LVLGGLLFFCCTRFRVYGLIGRGWASNSNYAILGAIRGVAQTISYEISLAFFFLGFRLLIFGFNLSGFMKNQEFVYFFILLFPVFLI